MHFKFMYQHVRKSRSAPQERRKKGLESVVIYYSCLKVQCTTQRFYSNGDLFIPLRDTIFLTKISQIFFTFLSI